MEWTDLIALARLRQLLKKLEIYFDKEDIWIDTEEWPEIVIRDVHLDEYDAIELLQHLRYQIPIEKKVLKRNLRESENQEENVCWKKGLILDQLQTSEEINDERGTSNSGGSDGANS